MRIQIREGNSGILDVLKEDGSQENFFPNCDLKESDHVLEQFYAVKKNGTSIRDSFWFDGINWFPTTMALLYWQFFFNYVKYREFIKKYSMEEHEYVFLNQGNLSQFVALLLKYSRKQAISISYVLKYLKNKISAWLVRFHNRKIFHIYHHASLLFFRLGLNDFRSLEQEKTLDKLGIQYLETVTYSNRQVILNLLKRKPQPLFFLIQLISNKTLDLFSIPKTSDRLLEKVFLAATFGVQDQILSFQKTCQFFKQQLKNTPVRCFYGIDYTNVIYPMIYACQSNGIRTIGHQHGASYGPYDAPYILKGFSQEEYKWFDTILVWGEYWRERVFRHARCYTRQQIKVGASMRPVLKPNSSDQVGDKGRKNILFPAEELTDTFTVGKYIIALQDLGYNIYLKLRPDGDAIPQIQTYCLPPEREKKIIYIDRITDELMSKIDIVAGTYSTVIYELIPFMKTNWLLATKFVYAEDMVSDGIAKLIRLESLEEDINQNTYKNDATLADRVYSPNSLYDVLKRELC